MVVTAQSNPTTVTAIATTDRCEAIYAAADGDIARVPWAMGRPHPALVAWLNAVAPSLIRCGARVVVVGCGLGDDARELLRRGYDVTAFDTAPTAIAWAQRRDPANPESYHVADLLAPPARWRHRFDLVVEVGTLEWMGPELRGDVLAAMSDLLSPHGAMIVIGHHAPETAGADDGPPWPLTESELEAVAATHGLVPDGPISVFTDAEEPHERRLRALFRRGRV